MRNFRSLKMREFAECLSGPGNGTELDPNVFCQGNLNSTVSASAAEYSFRRPSRSWNLLVSVVLIVLLLCEAVSADCLVTLQNDSVSIRQDAGRVFGPGIGCPHETCLANAAGLGELEGGAASRSIDGDDASDPAYDEFFEVLGQTTNPPRLFAARATVEVDFWSFGSGGSSSTWARWAPLSVSVFFCWKGSCSCANALQYCVNATASDCSEVEGTVEACGPLYQNDATGLEEGAVVQGIIVRMVCVRCIPTETYGS